MAVPEYIDILPSEDLLKMLQRYLRAFEILEASPARRKAPQYMEMLATPAEGKFVRWSPEMTSDEMAAVLHRVRPFVLHQEPFSFNNVVGRLKREIALRPLRDLLDRTRAKFEGEEWASFVRIKSGGEVLNTHDKFVKWLNAFEYHQDPEKQEFFRELVGRTPAGLVPWVNVKLLFEKIEAIGDVAAVARVVSGVATSAVVGACTVSFAA